jgi:hypothetical protein
MVFRNRFFERVDSQNISEDVLGNPVLSFPERLDDTTVLEIKRPVRPGPPRREPGENLVVDPVA